MFAPVIPRLRDPRALAAALGYVAGPLAFLGSSGFIVWLMRAV